MRLIRSTTPLGTAWRGASVLGVFLVASYVPFALPTTAGATSFSDGFSPTIVTGKADLNGDGAVTGRDDADAFYGDTHIIDGQLDCDAWGPIANAGTAGDGAIGAADDCSLVGYDGTPDGVTIDVVNGAFQVADGPLPTVFNAGDPSNPDVGASDFAWSTIDGRVDSNGNEAIDGDDCHFGLIGTTADAGLGDATDGADILGNPGANECGFATPPNTADNGLVDLNDDSDITSADSCADGCFFGHDVTLGKVQAAASPECPGLPGGSAERRDRHLRRRDAPWDSGRGHHLCLRRERHPHRERWQRPPARRSGRGYPERWPGGRQPPRRPGAGRSVRRSWQRPPERRGRYGQLRRGPWFGHLR